MAKTKGGKSQWWRIALFAVFIILGAYIFIGQVNKQPTSGYITYQDPRFTIEYPADWKVKTDTQVFENGDVVAFRIKGPTQKRYTELIDGAQFVVSKPFTIDTDLQTWMRSYFTGNAKFSKSTLARYPFEAVEDCSNFGCMRYLFTMINKEVYGVSLFAEGSSEEKASYENTLLYMLKSLKFTNADNTSVTEEAAISKIKALPQVIDYLKRVPNGRVEVNGEDESTYMVQVYEIKNGHTATFNWYDVDKNTAEVKKEF